MKEDISNGRVSSVWLSTQGEVSACSENKSGMYTEV